MSTKNLRGSKRLASYAVVLAALWALSGCSSSNGSTDTDGGSTDATTDVHVGTDSGGGKDSSVEAAPAEGGNTCSNGQTSCNGKCVTLSSDPTNCGTCGSTCGTGLVCSNGTCALSCGDGGALTQCGNGCYDLQTDSDNCGSCGTACTGGQVCQSGKCQQSCGSGSTLCGAQCVNTQSDNLNCGGCGTACAAGTVCSAGSCQLTCGGGLTHCSTDAGAVCKDLTSDGSNCGSCGNVCAGGTVCSASACVSSCGAGQIDCGGSCINPQTNPQYCGATGACGLGDAGTPGTTCATGQSCVAGACTIVCPPGQILCGGACVDPSSNNTYCGASGSACTGATACASGTLCTGGVCKTSCNPGQIVCNNTCVNPLTDLTYCGANGNCSGAAAGTKCPVGDVCSGGTCQITCGIGLIPCGGHCVDPAASLSYCGASGNCQGSDIGIDCTAAPFGTGYVCSAGACTLSCQAGLINCNNVCVDPTTSNQYCGASGACGNGGGSAGTKCVSGTVCSGSTCNLTCLKGQAECTENGTLQCINPNTDPNFCGAAGYSGSGNTTGQCNSATIGNANYQGIACSTGYAQGSSCATGSCSCPNGSGGASDKEVVCKVNGVNTCIDPLTNNSFCGANSGCGGFTDCSTISGSSCIAGSCQCPNGSGGATDKEVVCTVNGVKTCIDPLTDNAFCGANSACAGSIDCGGIKGSNCTGGTCSCPTVNGTKYVNCNVTGTQTCVDPTTSATNCGAGGNCKNDGTGGDTTGSDCTKKPLTHCGVGGAGYSCVDSCAANQIQCVDTTTPANSYCANYQTDNSNCGGCSFGSGSSPYVCGPLFICQAPNSVSPGQCVSTCPNSSSPTEKVCPPTDGTKGNPTSYYCTDISSDPLNCNGCGNSFECPAGNVCSSGHCQSVCSPPVTSCPAGSPPNPNKAYCADEATDSNNCGGCGTVCPGGTPSCVGSQCCPTGTTQICGGACTNTNTDKNHCGSCSAFACSGTCAGGVCNPCDPTTEVNYQGHCYYLDGSAGACDPGYFLQSNAILGTILAANPNAWQGLNYKHTVSGNCCIDVTDSTENYGMTANCNSAGPFTSGQPVAGGSGCAAQNNHDPNQLTICGK